MRRSGRVVWGLYHAGGELHEETAGSSKKSLSDSASSDRSPRTTFSPSQQVCDSQRVKIERAPAGNAKLSKANSATVLNCCPESCARDNDIHDFSASHSSRVIARKRTRSPARKSTGGSFCASNNRNGVRPITFQPPGDT